MRRREFIASIGSTAAAWPLRARAQQSKSIPRIGVLWHAGNEQEEAKYLGALRQGFRADVGQVRVGCKSEDHEGYSPENPRVIPCACRRGDRIT